MLSESLAAPEGAALGGAPAKRYFAEVRSPSSTDPESPGVTSAGVFIVVHATASLVEATVREASQLSMSATRYRKKRHRTYRGPDPLFAIFAV